jgi:putative transposase
LREAIKEVKARHPFRIHGWVVLPEHLHCVIELPPDDADFAIRLMLIKMGFSKALPKTERRSDVRVSRREPVGCGEVRTASFEKFVGYT